MSSIPEKQQMDEKPISITDLLKLCRALRSAQRDLYFGNNRDLIPASVLERGQLLSEVRFHRRIGDTQLAAVLGVSQS